MINFWWKRKRQKMLGYVEKICLWYLNIRIESHKYLLHKKLKLWYNWTHVVRKCISVTIFTLPRIWAIFLFCTLWNYNFYILFFVYKYSTAHISIIFVKLYKVFLNYLQKNRNILVIVTTNNIDSMLFNCWKF